MAEIPEDLQAAYDAEAAAEAAVVELRSEIVELVNAKAVVKGKLKEAEGPYFDARDTRRSLERQYGIGEWAPSGVPAATVAKEG